MNAREFETEFHSRTMAYWPGLREDRRPVVIEVPESAHTPAGHLLLSALTNQLVRAHQHLVFVGELERALLCPSPFGHRRLVEATAGLAREVNPLVLVDVVETSPRVGTIARLRVGAGIGGAVGLGAEGWRALIGEGAKVGEGASDAWGAMLAACLGAWIAFQNLLGVQVRSADSYSLWDYMAPGGAQGPDMEGPLDIGATLQVGAGGVGAALDYWLALVGVASEMTVVDGDQVEVSNLNRQILFNAADAGYPTREAANKATCAAGRLGAAATASAHWYGEQAAVVDADYDVVLALANERGAREALQDRAAPILLHATTSSNFQAQLHRHLPGVDDCIRCRLPGEAPVTECSTVKLEVAQGSDASLPFLSALSGLLLATALAHVSCGELTAQCSNLLTVDLSGEPTRQALRCSCRGGCRTALVS